MGLATETVPPSDTVGAAVALGEPVDATSSVGMREPGDGFVVLAHAQRLATRALRNRNFMTDGCTTIVPCHVEAPPVRDSTS